MIARYILVLKVVATFCSKSDATRYGESVVVKTYFVSPCSLLPRAFLAFGIWIFFYSGKALLLGQDVCVFDFGSISDFEEAFDIPTNSQASNDE